MECGITFRSKHNEVAVCTKGRGHKTPSHAGRLATDEERVQFESGESIRAWPELPTVEEVMGETPENLRAQARDFEVKMARERVVEELAEVKRLLERAAGEVAREAAYIEAGNWYSDGPLGHVLRANAKAVWALANIEGHVQIAASRAAELDLLLKASSMVKALTKKEGE